MKQIVGYGNCRKDSGGNEGPSEPWPVLGVKLRAQEEKNSCHPEEPVIERTLNRRVERLARERGTQVMQRKQAPARRP